MSSVEDKDLGFKKILQELRILNNSEVRTGIQGTEDSEMVKIAAIHEFGTREWTISSKQAYYMARVLMKIDPGAEPERFWGVFRKLKGRKMKIPERSFIRATFDVQQANLLAAAQRSIATVLEGKVLAPEALQEFAQFAEMVFRRGLLSIKDPPLSGLTISLKGSSKPLVNQGRLHASIRSIVARRGGGETE